MRAALGELPAASHPVLIVLSGLPGSGKSYFADRLRRRLPAVVVESDALRRVLFARPTYSLAESARLFAACHALIEALLAERRMVIFDATNLFASGRKVLAEIATRQGARYLLVRLFAPRALALARIGARMIGADPGNRSEAGPEVYERMRLAAERVTEPHIAVNSARDVGPAVERVARRALLGQF